MHRTLWRKVNIKKKLMDQFEDTTGNNACTEKTSDIPVPPDIFFLQNIGRYLPLIICQCLQYVIADRGWLSAVFLK
jgi:hypothetical protein